jgi:hypothetical protein
LPFAQDPEVLEVIDFRFLELFLPQLRPGENVVDLAGVPLVLGFVGAQILKDMQRQRHVGL